MGTITVLEAPVAMQQEVLACLGEISRRAKAAFAVHRRMLTGAGSAKQKMIAYGRFINPAALWAVGACHPHEALLKGANSIQLMQLRQALGIPRRALESWVDWNQRSLRFARLVLAQKPELRFSSEMLKLIWRLYGHMARHEDDSTALLRWRDHAWWEGQQADPQGARHPKRFNAMLNTERLLSQIARPWRQTAQNRVEWSRLEAAFIRRFDVPWATGKQTSLENLAPTRRPKPEAQRYSDGERLEGNGAERMTVRRKGPTAATQPTPKGGCAPHKQPTHTNFTKHNPPHPTNGDREERDQGCACRRHGAITYRNMQTMTCSDAHRRLSTVHDVVEGDMRATSRPAQPLPVTDSTGPWKAEPRQP